MLKEKKLLGDKQSVSIGQLLFTGADKKEDNLYQEDNSITQPRFDLLYYIFTYITGLKVLRFTSSVRQVKIIVLIL